MSSFGILYKDEVKKIISKKAVWISVALGLVFILLVGFTNLSADGKFAYVKQQEGVLMEISGQKLDQHFLDEFQQDIAEEMGSNPALYEKISNYEPAIAYKNAASNIGKNALYDLLYNTMRDRNQVATVTEASFYEKMRENIINDGRDLGASDEEIATWLEVFDGIEKPITYSYALAYLNIIDVHFIINWVLIICISIALAGVFADEKTYRTDALILSSKKGRMPICVAKLAAAVTVAIGEMVVLECGSMGIMVFFYGTGGWNAMIQNIIPSSPWNITIGNMMLIFMMLAVICAIFFALTNLLVSYFSKSAVVTMAVHAAIIFTGLFNIPGRMGFISKVWQLRPTMALYYGTFCNTYRYGGMNNVEASLLIYGICIVVFVIVLLASYRKAQVESR